jgi:DNA-nicking Smr family endonuclease
MSPEREIDLHGMKVSSALRFLTQELTFCRARRIGLLRVVVGRGWNSRGQQPVLGPAVRAWLQGPEGRALGVVDCKPDGRGGALLVRVKG